MGNFLSQFGLMMQGADQAREEQRQYDTATQAAEESKRRLAITEQEQEQLRQKRAQEIETTGYSLVDTRQNRRYDEEARVAGQTAAAGSDTPMYASFEAMEQAEIKNNRMDRALKWRQARTDLEQMGTKEIVNAARDDQTPGERQDLLKLLNSNPRTKGVQRVTFDGKDLITVYKNDQPFTISIEEKAARLKMDNPIKVQSAGQHGSILTGGALGGGYKTVSPMSTDSFDLKDGVLFNKGTGKWQQVDTKGDWHLGNVPIGNMEVPVRINKRDGTVERLGEGGVRTGMEAKITSTSDGKIMIALPGGEVAEFKAATEATPGESNWLSPNVPGTPARPAQLNTVRTPTVPGGFIGRGGHEYVEISPGNFRQVAPRGTAKAQQEQPVIREEKATNEDALARAGELHGTGKGFSIKGPDPGEQQPEQQIITAPASTTEQYKQQAQQAMDRVKQAKQYKADASIRRTTQGARLVINSPRVTLDDIPILKEGLAAAQSRPGLLTPEEIKKGIALLQRLENQPIRRANGGPISKMQSYGLG